MKKTFVLFILILGFLLVSCDYPEKDIHLLSEYEIPRVVTKDFVLPYGRLGPITYSSSHPNVLVITNLYDVKVNQQDEDVVVTIEARVKEAFKTINIKVLKKGSDFTIKEQADIAFEQLNEMIDGVIKKETILPNQINDIIFEYKFVGNQNYFMLIRKFDETKWLVPILSVSPTNNLTKVKVNILNDTEEYIPSYYLEVKYVYDNENLLAQEEIFLSLGIDFKYYNRGNATLYVNEFDAIDFNYNGDRDNVNVAIRLDEDTNNELSIRNKVLYVNKLTINKGYHAIVTIDIDGISQEFKVFIEKSQK